MTSTLKTKSFIHRAVLLLPLFFLTLTLPRYRAWLRRPHAYLAAALFFAIVTPDIAWNMTRTQETQVDHAAGPHPRVPGLHHEQGLRRHMLRQLAAEPFGAHRHDVGAHEGTPLRAPRLRERLKAGAYQPFGHQPVWTVRGAANQRHDLLAHLHVADCFNHRANVGNRYIVNPPTVDARVHQHNEIGNGDLDWPEFFGTLRELEFDGIATVCVFGWEEEADAIHRRMLERVDVFAAASVRATDLDASIGCARSVASARDDSAAICAPRTSASSD